MHYYKATIQYEGSNHCGFQWQEGIPTIQNDLNLALKKFIPGKVTTMGASRTDTGVHALEQIVKITTEHQLDCLILINQLNQTLHEKIKCLKINECEGHFKPANDSKAKEYRYFFTNALNAGSDLKLMANNPYPLNLEAMKFCVQKLVGEHDFQNFYSAGSNVKSTVRIIKRCELTEVDPHQVFSHSRMFNFPPELQHCYQLKIEGNGFLKQMIRHLMSALWLVGNGKLSTEEFLALLKGPKKQKRLWKVAPAKGLYLFQIKYE